MNQCMPNWLQVYAGGPQRLKKLVGQLLVQRILHFCTFEILLTTPLPTKPKSHLLQAEVQKVELLFGS